MRLLEGTVRAASVEDAPEDGTSRAMARIHLSLSAPRFAAPEQVRGELGSVSPRTDVYSLALGLLELMSDRPVIAGTSATEVTDAILSRSRPTPSSLGIEVSSRVNSVLERAVALRPEERQKNVREFWGMLETAVAQDRDSLERVSKLPLTTGHPVGERTIAPRTTLPEDERITLSPVEGATVPRLDADVIAVAQSEISFEDAPPLRSGVREAPPVPSSISASPPASDEAAPNDTVVMSPEDLRALHADDDPDDDDETVPLELRSPLRSDAPPPTYLNGTLGGYDSALLSPAGDSKPASNRVGVSIAVAFVMLAVLLCSGIATAAFFDWL